MQKRFFSLLVTLTVLCAAVFLPTTTLVRAASVYYVDAVNGSDTMGNGSGSNPWKTISKAAGVMQAGDTCRIRSGVYRETVTPANSGEPGAYITFEADSGANVTVSGADLVTSVWSVHNGNVYKTGKSLGMGVWKNQVFVDGVAMNLARWPNAGTNPMNPVFKEADSGTDNSKIIDSELTQPDGYWNGAAVLVMDHYRWAIASTTVSSYSTGRLNLSSISTYGLGVNSGYGSLYYVLGKLAALDSPNEWYYDSGTTTLYLQTPSSDNPADHTVEVKARNNAFNLAGKSHVRIKGVNLFASTIDASSANNCEIDGISARYPSHYELTFTGSEQNWKTSGIRLGGANNVLKNSTLAYSPGNLVSVSGENNKVINNLIHDSTYGPFYACEAACVYITGKGHLISHNTLFNSGRSVISGNPDNCRIQYNYGYNAMKLLDDGGFIYTATTDGRGTEIHHNIFNNAYSNPPHFISGGIYLDQGSLDFKVFNNVISNTLKFGVFFHHYNLFTHAYNNTFYNKSWFRMKNDGGALDAYGVRVINNISYDDFWLAPGFGVVDMNNFKSGDPLFVNAASKDFHLKSTSTAKDAGRVIEGITDGYSGSAPDIGAYEYGGASWTAGHNFSSPPNPSFTTTNIKYHNLVKNGFFERDTDMLGGWNKTNSQTAVIIRDNGTRTTARFAYMRGVRLGTGADGVEQTVTGLMPSTEYEIRGFAKAASSGQTVRIGIKNYGGSETYQEVNSTSWSEKKFRFTTGASNTSAVVYVYKPTTGGYAYADDVTLVEIDSGAEPEPTPTPLPTPEPGTVRVNDSVTGTGNNQFEFTGTWSTSNNVFCYMGDNHWSGTTNSYYRVRFNGVQIKLFSEANNNMGICAVSIDGGAETMVDTYSTTHEGNKLVYTSPVLSDGQHTLKVRVTGTKNAGSSGYFHVADRVDIISDPSATPAPTPTPGPTPAPVAEATFYQHNNYGGYAVALVPGEYTTAQLVAAGIANNDASSLRVPDGYTVTVYDGDNFTGSSWIFTSDVPVLNNYGCNDKMSAVKIVSSGTPTPTPTPATFSDDFESGALGESPAGWEIASSGGTVTVVQIADGENPDNKGMKIQRTSMGTALSASKVFTALTGIINIDVRMQAAQTNALMYGPTIKNSAGKDLIFFGFQANGRFGILKSSWQNLRTYTAGQWYNIHIELNTETDTFDLYIDGTIELDNQPLKATTTDVSKIVFSPYSWNNGIVYYDNVEVSQ